MFRSIQTALVALILLHGVARSDTWTWNTDASANWGGIGNWDPNTSIPNAVDAVAQFGNVISVARTISLDQDITVGTLKFDSSKVYTISGSNTLSLKTSSGPAKIQLTAASTNGATLAANCALESDTEIDVAAGAGPLTLEKALSGSGNLTKTGTGTLLINAIMTYTGDTLIKAGTVKLEGNAGTTNLPAKTRLTVDNGATFDMLGNVQTVGGLAGNGTITNSESNLSTLTIDSPAAMTFGGVFTGQSTFFVLKDSTFAGTSSLTLTGQSTLAGGRVESDCKLIVGVNNALGANAGFEINGTLDLNNFDQSLTTLNGQGKVENSGANKKDFGVQIGYFAGTIEGKLDLTKSGAQLWTLDGAASYTGSTTISDGILRVGPSGELPAASVVKIGANAALEAENAGIFVRGLDSNQATAEVRSAPDAFGGIDLNVPANETYTFDGKITGTMSFVKDGPGTQVLRGENSWQGVLFGGIVSGGTLTLATEAPAKALSTAAPLIVSGGTLNGTAICDAPVEIHNDGKLGGALTLMRGLDVAGRVEPRNPGGVTTLEQALNFMDTGTFSWQLKAKKDSSNGTPGTDFDQIVLSGGMMTFSADSQLELVIDNAIKPDKDDAFWQAAHQWVVILAGDRNQNFNLESFGKLLNGDYGAAGKFTCFATTDDAIDGSIVLDWNPAPEPSSLVLLLAGSVALRRQRSLWNCGWFADAG